MKTRRSEPAHPMHGGGWIDLLRLVRPETPPALRDRCLPGTASTAGTAPRRAAADAPGGRRGRRRRLLPLVASAALIALAAILVPARMPRAAAAAALLETAVGALQDVEAIVITQIIDDGTGQDPDRTFAGMFPAWRFISRAGLGSRFETGGVTEIYDARDRQIATFDADSGTVELSGIDAALMRPMMLARTRVHENLDVLRLRAGRDRRSVRDSTVIRDGRRIRVLSSTDEHGRPVLAEIDAQTGRVLRTESWFPVLPSGEAGAPIVLLRAVTVCDYPDPGTLDPALFHAIPPAATTVIRLSPEDRAVRQCMTNMRTLAVLVHAFAQRNGDRLPDSLDALAPYAERPIAFYVSSEWPGSATGLTVESRLDSHGEARLDTLDWTDAVLFACALPDGRIVRCYADSRVEVHSGTAADPP